MFGRNRKNKQPESIALDAGAKYVGFMYRFGAALVDVALIAAIAVPAIFIAVGGLAEPGLLHGVIVLAVVFFYTVGSCWWKSRTFGLWLVSAIIVDIRSGGKPRLWQFVVRFFGVVVSLLPAALGLFWAGWNRRKRGWQDYLARTAVVGDPTFRPLRAEETTNLADSIDSWITSH